MTATMRAQVMWVTSNGMPTDHAVADGERASDGVFVGVCGVRFASASMCTAPGPVCSRCRAVLEARTSMRTVERRLGATRHRAPGVVARLVAAVFASRSPTVPTPLATRGVMPPDGAAGLCSRWGRGGSLNPSPPASPYSTRYRHDD